MTRSRLHSRQRHALDEVLLADQEHDDRNRRFTNDKRRCAALAASRSRDPASPSVLPGDTREVERLDEMSAGIKNEDNSGDDVDNGQRRQESIINVL